MLNRHPEDQVALALPDDEPHRARIGGISLALGRLGIGVFFAAVDRKVRVLNAGR
jgi:hypothetical protein